MKRLLILFTLTFLSFQTEAHAYFFGFAELNYNVEEGEYEGTLILSTHDVEDWLKRKEVPIITLEDHIDDYEIHALMELEIFEGFEVKSNDQGLIFQLIGYEILDNGMTQFYFHSNKTDKGNELDITFDLMMDEFPQQQNKINYIENNRSLTAVFLKEHRQTSISLK